MGGSAFGSGIVGGSIPSTTALVGPGAAASTVSSRPSKFSGRDGLPPPSAYGFDEDVERHQDGGPATFLQRSASGRLPPAYQSWDEEPNDVSSAASTSQYNQSHSGAGSSVGVDPYGAASVAGSSEPSVPPPLPPLPGSQQYPRDVKRPLPP